MSTSRRWLTIDLHFRVNRNGARSSISSRANNRLWRSRGFLSAWISLLPTIKSREFEARALPGILKNNFPWQLPALRIFFIASSSVCLTSSAPSPPPTSYSPHITQLLILWGPLHIHFIAGSLYQFLFLCHHVMRTQKVKNNNKCVFQETKNKNDNSKSFQREGVDLLKRNKNSQYQQ